MTSTPCYHLLNLDSPDECAAWNHRVECHPASTPFHHTSWLKLLRTVYRFTPVCLMDASTPSEWIFPLFLVKNQPFGTRLVSLPFSDYGGPLCAPETQPALLAEILAVWQNDTDYIEIRNAIPENGSWQSTNHFRRYVLTVPPDLQAFEQHLERKTMRYSLRKARRSGVVVEPDNTPEGLAILVHLNRLTRRRHGVPPQPTRFFNTLFQHIIQRGKGFILIARLDDRPVAAGLFLQHNRDLYYKYNASDPQAIRQCCPNHLLTWRAIEMAHQQEKRLIDFGRVATSNDGLAHNKKLWGCSESPCPYSYYPAARGALAGKRTTRTDRLRTRLWQQVPLSLTQGIGNLVYHRFA